MSDLTKTGMREMLDQAIPKHRAPAVVHRKIEDYGFVAACTVVLFYGLGMAVADTSIRLGLARPASCAVGIPWWFLIVVGALVLPKTLGRVTAGKIWTVAAERFVSRKADE